MTMVRDAQITSMQSWPMAFFDPSTPISTMPPWDCPWRPESTHRIRMITLAIKSARRYRVGPVVAAAIITESTVTNSWKPYRRLTAGSSDQRAEAGARTPKIKRGQPLARLGSASGRKRISAAAPDTTMSGATGPRTLRKVPQINQTRAMSSATSGRRLRPDAFLSGSASGVA